MWNSHLDLLYFYSNIKAYYPVNDDRNQALCQRYQELAARESNVIFGGRLAEYKYYDMDDVIKSALEKVAAVCEWGKTFTIEKDKIPPQFRGESIC